MGFHAKCLNYFQSMAWNFWKQETNLHSKDCIPLTQENFMCKHEITLLTLKMSANKLQVKNHTGMNIDLYLYLAFSEIKKNSQINF